MPRFFPIIIGGVGVLLIVVILVFGGILPGRKSGKPPAAELEFWGIGDDDEIWIKSISAFKNQNQQISIRYQRMDREHYEEELLNRLAEGKGPDVFMFDSIWIAKHRDKLFPLPSEKLKITARDFSRLFADVAVQDLVSPEGKILGFPLSVDTPALFTNRDIFNAEGIVNPPKDREEFIRIARSLTKLSDTREIERSGAAFGSFRNIERAFEIVSSLLFQYGDPIIDARTRQPALQNAAKEAFEFYAGFADRAKPDYSWNARLQNSLDMFAEGRAAMIFGFAEDIRRLNRKNPRLQFTVSSFPQEKEGKSPVVYGRSRFLAVSKLSKHPLEAWSFIFFVSSPEQAKIYTKETGSIPARRDLIALGAPSDDLDPFYRQTLIARSWPVPDEKIVMRLFEEAVDALPGRSNALESIVGKLQGQLQLLIP
jgi:multiple sugar transport system substrate-binding protein